MILHIRVISHNGLQKSSDTPELFLSDGRQPQAREFFLRFVLKMLKIVRRI